MGASGGVSETVMIGLQQALHGLLLAEREMLLFAAFWFVVGTIDELAVDLCWLWLRLTGRRGERRLPSGSESLPLIGRAAVLVPAWHESGVIATMVRHTLQAWPQRDLVLYVGCYCNDAATIAAAAAGGGGDSRLRIVVNERDGPTTKADCLNRLYRALCEDEARSGETFASIVLHDAEDMVHPAALGAIDRALAEVDFVQLPVQPELQPSSRLVAGHYADEFTETHAKSMMVRDGLGAAIPAAGVGCGFAREAMRQLAAEAGPRSPGPFAAECLTEDYELGLRISRRGRGGRFVRLRAASGDLVATRAYFPASLETSVRQKSRWIHGIAFQSWDRLGWSGRPVDVWMSLRDRKGPLTALVLAVAYFLVGIEAVLGIGRVTGVVEPLALSPALRIALSISFVGFAWRAAWRFGFTAREYGATEGLRSVLRVPVGNVVAIMAGRRALLAYVRTLTGASVVWDKTHHDAHPAVLVPLGAAR